LPATPKKAIGEIKSRAWETMYGKIILKEDRKTDEIASHDSANDLAADSGWHFVGR
jgi:hypothetical protein